MSSDRVPEQTARRVDYIESPDLARDVELVAVGSTNMVFKVIVRSYQRVYHVKCARRLAKAAGLKWRRLEVDFSGLKCADCGRAIPNRKKNEPLS